jgi:UPF0755 protein
MSDSARPRSSPPSKRRQEPQKRGSAPSSTPRPRARAPRSRAASKGLSPRARAALWIIAAITATLALAAGLLVVGYGRSQGPTTTAASGSVEVDWPPGMDSDAAAARLVELGLADGREALALFFRATGGTDDFVPGPHLLPQGATPWELRRLLGRSLLRANIKLTIPEGFCRYDIAARLEKLRIAGKKAFLNASSDAALLAELGVAKAGMSSVESAEGYLFPATYEFPADTDPRDIVRRLVKEADRRWEALVAQRRDGLASLAASLGWSRREVIILASIIEKEAVVDEERPLIASVFLNRLVDPAFTSRRLESDPTGMYGCLAFPDEAPTCADFNGKPSPAVNRDSKNRYNTYRRGGLPPGPIANPGIRSLEAVLAPAPTRYFYFYATGGGRHTFSEEFGAHTDVIHRGRPEAPAKDAGR